MAEGPAGWVNILADTLTATVSTRVLLAQADSHLAQLVELEVQRNPSSPAVRLDTSAAVAGEVVAALRQGSAYMLPVGDRRLLAAVKHQLDFLGVQLQPSAGDQQYVVVPSYDLTEVPAGDLERYGLLLYSSASRGWANRAGDDDPRHDFLKFSSNDETKDMGSLACVIRSEYTSVGEDVIYVIHNGVKNICSATALAASTLKSSSCRAPPGEFTTICDSALASAKDKLYMLGGEALYPQASRLVTPLRIYEPRIDTWFVAQPPSSSKWLTNSELVSNLQERMLLSIGGFSGTSDMMDTAAPMSDRVAMFDINSGRWTNNPSGCTWPGAAQTGPRGSNPSLSATAFDEYSIMVVAGARRQQARVDVRDLRTWRWREAIAQLEQPGMNARGVAVVAYQGQVLALGGEEMRTPAQQANEEGEDAEAEYERRFNTGTKIVHSCDPAANVWSSDAVARLPFGINRASPVVARVSA